MILDSESQVKSIGVAVSEAGKINESPALIIWSYIIKSIFFI